MNNWFFDFISSEIFSNSDFRVKWVGSEPWSYKKEEEMGKPQGALIEILQAYDKKKSYV